MDLRIQTIRPEDCAMLSGLALRSKAYWGYDSDFMDQCVAELTLHAHELSEKPGQACWEDDRCLGFYQFAPEEEPMSEADEMALDLLYVEPAAMGRGVGRLLFEAALGHARKLGAAVLTVVADPQAEAFYQRMGAVRQGMVPSGSIADRLLPKLRLSL